jgi:transposase InsO family protein
VGFGRLNRTAPHPVLKEPLRAARNSSPIADAFPDDAAPAHLLRDRDTVYGHPFRQRVKGRGIREVLTAPHSRWQNPFAERLSGSIRRECLDHGVPRNAEPRREAMLQKR